MNRSAGSDSRTTAPAPASPTARGVEDTSGWGLLGLTLGIVVGFMASVPFAVALFPKPVGNWSLTIMTTLVVVAMTIGGAIGYLVTRRVVPPPTTAR